MCILKEKLKEKGYIVSYFPNKEEAVEYLEKTIINRTIGFGDSQTIETMNLYDILSRKNTVFDPNQAKNNEEFLELAKKSLTTDIFVTSVNGITEDGIIVNLDGTGNRVAGSIFGHEKTYYIIGKNKVCKGIDEAIWRVRNVAAPMNAKRLHLKTPCSKEGNRCYDCSSADRICNGLLIEYRKMRNIEMEVLLIEEELGY